MSGMHRLSSTAAGRFTAVVVNEDDVLQDGGPLSRG